MARPNASYRANGANRTVLPSSRVLLAVRFDKKGLPIPGSEYVWCDPAAKYRRGKRYQPNSKRECARRRAAIARATGAVS